MIPAALLMYDNFLLRYVLHITLADEFMPNNKET